MLKPLPHNTTEQKREQLVGEWATEDGSCKMNFDSKGIGRCASLEWNDESGEFEVHSQLFILTQVEDDFYLSVQSDEGDGDSAYELVQCVISKANFIIWGPDTNRFEELIQQKKLTGEVDYTKHATNISLTNSPKEIVEVLKKEKALFDYKKPIVLRKLSE